jgi:hypothetical protein
MVQISEGLRRCKHGARNTGTAFIDAIKFSIAEIALHVAARGDRKMNAPVFLMRILAEAGMVVKVNPGRVHR